MSADLRCASPATKRRSLAELRRPRPGARFRLSEEALVEERLGCVEVGIGDLPDRRERRATRESTARGSSSREARREVAHLPVSPLSPLTIKFAGPWRCQGRGGSTLAENSPIGDRRGWERRYGDASGPAMKGGALRLRLRKAPAGVRERWNPRTTQDTPPAPWPKAEGEPGERGARQISVLPIASVRHVSLALSRGLPLRRCP
jgi:hypothetical protein